MLWDLVEETNIRNESSKKIHYGQHKLDDSDIEAVVEILKNGPITQGETVEKFGKELANYSSAKYGLAVSNFKIADMHRGEERYGEALKYIDQASKFLKNHKFLFHWH